MANSAHPYLNLESKSFWSKTISLGNPNISNDIFSPKFKINKSSSLATAGSCFAQHISKYLRINGFNLLDVEPPPKYLLSSDFEGFGYEIYSARYGNIYTSNQLLQLFRETIGTIKISDDEAIWESEGKFYDAFRPSLFPGGLSSPDEVKKHRKYHLNKLRKLFLELDTFIFTLGLTECWGTKKTNLVYPVCPGVIAGVFSDKSHCFKNLEFMEIYGQLNDFWDELVSYRSGKKPKVILTVSPVPLVATASIEHALVANTYSKSLLRAVAGEIVLRHEYFDYFPAYELISNVWYGCSNYDVDQRTILPESVNQVMKIFFSSYGFEENNNSSIEENFDPPIKADLEINTNKLCDELVYDVFSRLYSKNSK
jgi:hypothetical protein